MNAPTDLIWSKKGIHSSSPKNCKMMIPSKPSQLRLLCSFAASMVSIRPPSRHAILPCAHIYVGGSGENKCQFVHYEIQVQCPAHPVLRPGQSKMCSEKQSYLFRRSILAISSRVSLWKL